VINYKKSEQDQEDVFCTSKDFDGKHQYNLKSNASLQTWTDYY